MNIHSIKFRLAAWYAGVLFVVCISFSIYTFLGLRYYLQATSAVSLQRRARQIGAILTQHIGREGERFTIDLLKTSYAPEHNDRYIRVRRGDGSTLYVSGHPSDHAFDPASISLPPFAAADSQLISTGNLLLVQTSAEANGARYFIDCGASNLPGAQVLRGFLLTLLLGITLVLIAAAGGGVLLVGKALMPVRNIIDGAKAITSCNVGHRLPVPRTNDELEHLTVVLNEMIDRLDRAFQHSQRFSADASHELRTPLTIMRIELENLTQEQDLDRELRGKLASILEETERLVKTVEGLFAISRLETGEAVLNPTLFDLSVLAVTTADQIALLAEEKGIALHCSAPGEAPVYGDRFRLKQVLVNLLDNAIKYTPEGGRVQLAVSHEANSAVMRVSDTGPGIARAALPQIFDRFFRADTVRTHSSHGAGLGLSIVRSICIAHGGTVEAANSSEGGCVITVRLPVAPAQYGFTTPADREPKQSADCPPSLARIQ